MSKKLGSQKKIVKTELLGGRKPVSNMSRLRRQSDRKIQSAVKKDPDSAPFLIDWSKDTKVVLESIH